MKLHQLVLVILGIVLNAFAEMSYDPFISENPFSDQTVIGSTTKSSKEDQNSLVSTAGGETFVGTHLVDTSNVPDVSGMDMRGRRSKTEDSLSSGGAGVGAAIAAGTALTATGIRLLPWPTTPQGIALITLGSIEFAQAGITAGINAENTSGRDILKNGTPSGKTLFMVEETQEKIKEKINTPELQKVLSENGVDSDTFINNLASGSFKNPEETMKALNIQADISHNELKNAMDNAITNFSLNTTNDQENTLRIELSEKEMFPQSSHNGVHSFTRTNKDIISDKDTVTKFNNDSQYRNLAMTNQKVLEKVHNNNTKYQLNINEELQKLFLGEGRKPHVLSQDQTNKLNLLGIKNLRSRQNIFHVSRSTYRAYWKWIKKEKNNKKTINTAMLFR